MFRNLLMTLAIVMATCTLAFAQQGRLKGKITDENGDPVPFTNVVLEKGGTMVGGAVSDFDGNYDINPIPPGTYDLKASNVTMNKYVLNGIVIPANKITDWNIKMTSASISLDEITVIDYEVPLISKDNTTSGASITAEEIAKLPNRSASGVASTVGGVYSADGEVGSIRGSREGAVTYIDGVKVIGNSSVPQSAIDQVDVILGGTPAMYGDAMGGIINVTTKGPSRTFGAGLELETSVEGYGRNRLGFSVQGPLIKGKQAETALLGFFLAGDLAYNKVGSISATGYYTANEEYQKKIEENPLVPSGIGNGTYQTASFTKKSDLVYSKLSTNTSNYSVNLSGNINVRTTETINLTIGGSYYRSMYHNFSRSYSYFNTAKNSIDKDNTIRGYVRFTQRFPTDSKSTSLIRNFYYSIQADYTRYNNESGDPDLWDNVFAYGNLGRFITHKMATYQLGDVDSILTPDGYHNYTNVYVLNSWDYDTLVDFEASQFNPLLAKYTQSVYDLYGSYGATGYYDNFTDLQLNGGLLNGRSAPNVYGMYSAPGNLMSNYSKYVSDQISLNVNASMTVGSGESSHEVKLGFQYEQRNTSGMSYSTDYWTLMRGLVNSHIMELDVANPYVISYDGFVDTIRYHRFYDGEAQSVFDKNLRIAMGLPVKGTEYILIDSYNFDDNTIMYYDENGVLHDPVEVKGGLDISMFKPDELTRDGDLYVSYYGYTYDGQKHKWSERPTLDDFFTEQRTDKNGNVFNERPVGSNQPIYTAGYIQDKFAFKDLIFQIGVRADRFDANQFVLKDPFILYQYKTVGDLRETKGEHAGQILLPSSKEYQVVPSTMGDDYAIYVNKVSDINEIVGYRSGNTWYNADGNLITTPTVLDKGSGVSPWLVNPDQQRVDKESFKDYEPSWTFMPRISFSFPISDEALFFAHYDVLTQRPSSNYFITPLTYYYFNEMSGALANPNLKPMQTIDYELGFTQKINNTSSFTITAYYREIRNMIQMYRLTGAYPKDYTSYSNLDFGTTKGLTAEYDLRRTKNVRVRANYTLQYASMTGASTSTASALISAGVPNLRSTFPTGFDRRHALSLTVDYRFSSGKKYDGPVIKREKSGKSPLQLLANAGVAMTVTGGSGAPYTASRTVTSPLSGGASLLKGTYFGSRMPASFKIDLRADKDFYFTMGGKKEGKTGREVFFNVYVNVTNLLNAKNILSVYSATGDADDDGYLTSTKYRQEIYNQLDPEAFIDMYRIYVNAGGNYSTPRQIKVGASFNF